MGQCTTLKVLLWDWQSILLITNAEITNTNGKVWSHMQIDKSGRGIGIPSEFKLGNDYEIDIFRRNKVTLLTVSYSTFSDSAVETFLSEIPPCLNKLTVRPILNPLKWILWSRLIGLRENSFAIFGDVPGSIEVFGMENKYAGYVFLIDAFGAIRWKAAGPATPQELLELHNTIKTLTDS